MINRRSFLKSIATACGAAVVCPGELLKPAQPALKLWAMQKIMIEKIRQQGCTNSILYGIPYYFRGVPIHYQENLST